MAGRSKRIVGYGIAIGVLIGGASFSGLEILIDEPAFGGRFIRQPFVPPMQSAPAEQTQDGFVVAASGTSIQDTPAGEALKLIEDGQWVKAIQAIESLSTVDSKLVVDERGVLRPLSAMKSALIASMPEEGRRTFNKLNDAAANAKLAETLVAVEIDPRASAFKSIVDSYALCDAAAQAAKHLGDIRFEQGRFNEAATYYRFASEHPATTADDPALMARRLTALSRAEQWNAFDELAAYARFRHPKTSIKIAGQDMPIQSLVTELVASRGEVPTPQTDTTARPLAMPKDAELDYDKPLIDEQDLKLIKLIANNHNFGNIIDQTIAPLVATDGERVFTLALGSVARLDPETGTELWRNDMTQDVIKAMRQSMRQLTSGYHQSLIIQGDMILVGLPGTQHDIHYSYLTAIDSQTGETRWSYGDTQRQNNETLVGTPLVTDDLVYFVAYRTTTKDLILRAVRLSDGAEAGELTLGKASKGPHMNTPAELSPRLTMGQGYLMVQTNNGALIAVDPNAMKIAWAYTQKIRPSGLNMMRRRGMAVRDPLAKHTGEVVATDGLIIAKDTRTNQVIALREYDATMVWQVETDADATIVHHDNQHIYVLGKELVALDRRTGERVWWTPHPGERSGQPVFTKDACLIAGNLRFCRIDLTNGKLTDYREDLAQAASLHVVGDRLIRITEQHLSAIALP